MPIEFMTFFKTQGPWALLFVFLLGWVLHENAKREERLISVIEGNLKELSEDVKDMKSVIAREG